MLFEPVSDLLHDGPPMVPSWYDVTRPVAFHHGRLGADDNERRARPAQGARVIPKLVAELAAEDNEAPDHVD